MKLPLRRRAPTDPATAAGITAAMRTSLGGDSPHDARINRLLKVLTGPQPPDTGEAISLVYPPDRAADERFGTVLSRLKADQPNSEGGTANGTA